MTGQLIGQLILWLIFTVIVIFILYWVMHWLYKRSTKEVAFVRTGFLGERVVINGGAFVWPIVHDITPVNMNSLALEITREKEEALITKDRMRIDVDVAFYIRVRQTREAVSLAASTLGRRTLEPERIHSLLAGKFISALRTVASQMTLEELHENRGLYVDRVLEAAQVGLDKNGLELESVAITDIDQTDIQYFNPSNRFDAEGLTSVVQAVEERRKLRNDIEQDTAIQIRARNLQAEFEQSGEAMSPGLHAAVERGRSTDNSGHAAALEIVDRSAAFFAELFQDFDAILTHSAPGAAPAGLDSTGDPVFCTIWTSCGLPCLSLPLLRDTEGMPMGIQLVGGIEEDDRLCRTARWLLAALADE